MATLITKNSQTASAVPSAGSLSTGELAVNTADAKLYTKHSDGSVKEVKPSTVSGTVAVANGGTGATSLTANNVLLGNGTSAVQTVAPGTSGNVLVSDGTTWTSAAPSGGGQLKYELFTSSTTWTCPAGVTKVFAWVAAGSTGAVRPSNGDYGDMWGSPGRSAWGYYTVVPGTSYTITIGSGGTGVKTSSSSASSTSGSSSFGSFLTCGGTTISQSYDVQTTTQGSVTGGMTGSGGGNGGIPKILELQTGIRQTGDSNPIAYTTAGTIRPNSTTTYNGTSALGGVGGAVYLEYVG